MGQAVTKKPGKVTDARWIDYAAFTARSDNFNCIWRDPGCSILYLNGSSERFVVSERAPRGHPEPARAERRARREAILTAEYPKKVPDPD